MSAAVHTALWERLDAPGWESVCLQQVAAGWEIDGRYVGRHEGAAVAAEYRLILDPHWVTVRLEAAWGLGPARTWLTLDRIGTRWRANGTPRPDLDGCIDVDIRWTPLTNTLPIRRLGLQPGDAREIEVAWVGEGDLAVGKNAQRYTRTGARTWRFEALENGFAADLEVDDLGLVVDYPALFRRLC